MTCEFDIVRSRLGPAVLVRLEGPLQGASAAALIERLGQLVSERVVLIDLRAVSELDCFSLARLSEYVSRAARGRTAFVYLSEPGSEVDEALGLESSAGRIPTLPSTTDAMEAIVGLTLYGDATQARDTTRPPERERRSED